VSALSGRVALVTGAGRGVGAAIAHALAGAGATVAVNDVVMDRAAAVSDRIIRAGGRAIPVIADVTDPGAVEGMVRAVTTAWGTVDVLVNNAGIPAEGVVPGKFVASDPKDWSAAVDLCLYGVMVCTHAVLEPMISHGWGRIVTIGSDSARTGDRGIAVYAAAKAGAASFMRSLSAEVAPDGITCNTLSLGTIRAPQMTDEVSNRLARRYPAGRLGRPDDVAGAVVWLCGDSGEWITGQTIPLNGGYASS
jgi:3-oxoacyl-[acyl-carrier protein] reductase